MNRVSVSFRILAPRVSIFDTHACMHYSDNSLILIRIWLFVSICVSTEVLSTVFPRGIEVSVEIIECNELFFHGFEIDL